MKNTKTALALNNILPPGVDKGKIKSMVVLCIICAFLVSLTFYMYYASRLRGLYYEGVIDSANLIKDSVMPDFAPMAKSSLSVFFLMAACMPALAVYFYKYYYLGTKSIYLMRRLPQRFEIFKRTVTVPVLLLCFMLVLAFAVLIIEFAVYMLVTPDQCITPHQWQKIWR